MTSKSNRTPIICCFKLFASFLSHPWIQSYSPETPNSGQNWRFSLQWRHYGIDSVSNHQPHDCLLKRLFGADQRKHQSSASLAFVRGIHRRPVNSPHKRPVTRKMFPFDEVIMFFPCELEIWQMTLKNNMTLLLCYSKLCASFHSHLWIQTGVTIRKTQIGAKKFDLCDLDLWALTLTFSMDIPSVSGDYYWKFHDDIVRETLRKRCERNVHTAAWS